MSKFKLTSELPPYIFAAINDIKQSAIDNNIELIDFGMGNPDSAPPDHVMNYLGDLIKNSKLYGYSTVGGINELRQTICQYYSKNFNVKLDYKTQSIVTI